MTKHFMILQNVLPKLTNVDFSFSLFHKKAKLVSHMKNKGTIFVKIFG